MQILLNTIALEPNRWTKQKKPYFALNELLPKIAETGFTGLEIWQYHLSWESKQQIREYGRQIESLGLNVPILGLYPQLHFDGRAAEDEFRLFTEMCEAAKEFGAANLKIWLGRFSPHDLDGETQARSLSFLDRMLTHAGSMKLQMIGEMHENTLFDSAESCEKFFSSYEKAEEILLCYQPFDFKRTDKALDDFARFNRRIIHVHLQGRKDGAFCLLQDADIDYPRLFSEMKQHKTVKYASIEFVKNCVVERPEDFDLPEVLANAWQDLLFIERDK